MLSKICCFNTDINQCSCLGLTRNKLIKIGYLLIILIGYSILLIINTGTPNYSDDTASTYGCLATNAQDSLQAFDIEDCLRNKNSEMVFGGVAVMHFLLMCSMFCKSEKVKIINEGLWIIKLMVAILTSLFLRLTVGTTFFIYLEYFSVWTANLTYIFIAIVFIDLAYALDAYLDECSQQNSKIYILKAILAITLTLTASFLAFLSFTHNNNTLLSWTNAIATLLFLIAAILRAFPGNSILVASLISLCINTIGFYVGNGDGEQQQWSGALVIIKILFIFFLLIGMLCQGSNKLRTRKSTLNQLLALNTNTNEQDNRYVSSNKWTVYHYIMIIISITIPAVISWNNKGNQQKVDQWLSYNNQTWWIATILLYIWSLICSKLFPQKDFSDLENYFREYQLQ